jgi:NADPH-dependent 2,4-dienoyl-CoA reductase/sulfur reductase-like enzyme
MNRVVIIGASAGGLATAEALRRTGYRGVITLVGDEPALPYDRPPLSKQLLAGQWEPDRLALRMDAAIDALGLELRLGVSATALDTAHRVVTLADDARVPYDALVIATDVRPRQLPSCPDGVHVLRTLPAALALKERLRPGQRLVIVVGGFVGAEVAATARGLGVEVTVLESAPVPLALAVGEEAGRFLTSIHHDHGVRIDTGAAVTEITDSGVRLADGTVVSGDDVLLAIGSAPNTEWLAGSGLAVHNGLICDEYCAAAPTCTGSVTWPAGTAPCSARTCGSSTAPTRRRAGHGRRPQPAQPGGPKAVRPGPVFLVRSVRREDPGLATCVTTTRQSCWTATSRTGGSSWPTAAATA